ncbi:MAG: hypothetical protein P1V81_12250 [Planctomycetota bacterium]|nr:hypothetical protein [Planctomycetota bacterium]
MDTTDTPQQEYGKFVFVFLGVQREREPVLGAEEQRGGTVFVYRALPGHVVAWGETQEQAVKRLREAVGFAMTETDTPEEWYWQAMADLSDEDHREQTRVMAQVFENKGVKWTQVELTYQEHRPLRALVFETAPVLRGLASCEDGEHTPIPHIA